MRINHTKIQAFLFILLISAPFGAGIFGVKSKNLEDRNYASAPKLESSSTLVSADFYRALAEYLSDHLPMRSRLVTFNGHVYLTLWNDSASPKSFIGKNGMLFCDSDLVTYCDEPDMQGLVNRLGQFIKLMQTHHKKVLFMVAPNKNGLYADRMTWRQRQINQCSAEGRAALRADLTPYANDWLLDLWNIEADAIKKAPPDRPPYYMTDDHWTGYGAAAADEAIINRLRPGLWDGTAISYPLAQKKTGGMMRFMGIPPAEARHDIAVTRKGITPLPPREVTIIDKRPPMEILTFDGPAKDFIAGNAFLLHDSYGDLIGWGIEPYFRKLTDLNWGYSTPEAIIAQIKDADIIIIETAERDLVARMRNVITPEFMTTLEIVLKN